MRRLGHVCVAMLLIIAACTEGSSPTETKAIKTPSKSRLHANVVGVDQAGNSFYQVFVSSAVTGIGQYTVMTGPSHPVTVSTGSPKNVLYGDGVPETSYNTIHSYTTGTDYVANVDATTGNNLFVLDPSAPGVTAVVTPIGTTGYRTTYTLSGPPNTPDAMTIVQDVNVHGTTFANSTVEVTTTVTNNGSAPLSIGIRYLWDTQIGEDDGPTFQQLSPDAPVLLTEKTFPSPSFGFYRIQDNNGNATTPLFSVFGTVAALSTITPVPTVPDLLENANWATSFQAPFAYTTTGIDVSTAGGADDNAVLYYWGSTQANALVLAGGASRTVSQSLVSAEANAPPPFNQPPVAAITSPANNASFAQGASVSFAGTGTDPEDGTLTGASLVWTDNVSGQIGTGTSFSTSGLAAGAHTITLTVTDSQGAHGTATRTITITGSTQNQSPVAHITAPTNGNVFAPGATIAFAGTGTDAEDGTLTGASLVWSDNVSGQLGTGTAVSTAALAQGPHTITLTVTDSHGATGTATVSMTIGFTGSIGTAGGSLCVESCHLSFYFPAGALSSTVNFVVYNVPLAPVPPAKIVGGAVVVSPLANLSIPGELGIGYDPSTLPAGVTEGSLRLFQFVSGSWHQLDASGVNTTSHIVYGQTSTTGVFAIVGTP